MKLFSRSLACLLVVGLALLTGCGGGDEGSDQNYDGTWQGRTSHGGTITFTVSAGMVTTLRLEDPEASLWFPQPVAIVGNTFEAEYVTDTASTDDVRLQGSFDSSTHSFGTYSIRKGSQKLAGTFEALR